MTRYCANSQPWKQYILIPIQALQNVNGKAHSVRGVMKANTLLSRAGGCLDFFADLCYNRNMEYRRKNTSVSLVNYHIVMCPRYRRKIFLIDGLEARFKELVTQICEHNDFVVIAMECDADHVHLFVNVPPTVSPADVVRIIKTNTARVLVSEFPQLHQTKQLWTRSYFASTAGDVSVATIKRYVEMQKKRG